MKNIKYLFAIIIAIVGIGFIACNDEDYNNNSDGQIIVPKLADYVYGYFFYDSLGDPNCTYEKRGNCLPVVTVTAEKLRMTLTNFYVAVNNKTYVDFIRKNTRELSECFSTDVLDAVLNNTLTIECSWNSQLFFIFKDVKGNVVNAYPFNLNK